MSLHIGIVVGEISGDILGAKLILELLKYYPDLKFSGVLGAKLIELGGTNLFDVNKISSIGFIDPIIKLPNIIRCYRKLINNFLNNKIDIFIGVDFAEFNLILEYRLKALGILTVHYVCPTFWAWRKNRVNRIKKATDLVLLIFPFELEMCIKHKINAKFVGHPLTKIALLKKEKGNYSKLKYDLLSTININLVILLLPGSRYSEVKNHSLLYLRCAKFICNKHKGLIILSSVANVKHYIYIMNLKNKMFVNLNIYICIDQSHNSIMVSDIALVTSGTATLEVMLYDKPMIVSYITNFITYNILKKIIITKYISIPNLIFNKNIVKEFIQSNASVQNIGNELLNLIDFPEYRKLQINEYKERIKCSVMNGNCNAANEIIKILIGKKPANDK